MIVVSLTFRIILKDYCRIEIQKSESQLQARTPNFRIPSELRLDGSVIPNHLRVEQFGYLLICHYGGRGQKSGQSLTVGTATGLQGFQAAASL